jgi:hypothetical protein
MPNRKKPNTLFLPARIKRLMQKDEEVRIEIDERKFFSYSIDLGW